MTIKLIQGVVHQWCNRGRHWLPQDVEHFGPNRDTPHGLDYTCRECAKKRNRQYMAKRYEAHPVTPDPDILPDVEPADTTRKCPACRLTLPGEFFRVGHARCTMCEQQDGVDAGVAVLRAIRQRKAIA